MQATNILDNAKFDDSNASKQQIVKTDQITVDALWLKPGQEHGPFRLPIRDRVIVGVKGTGYVLLMTEPIEQRIELAPGMIAMAPRGTWHLIKNTGESDLVLALTSQFPSKVEELG